MNAAPYDLHGLQTLDILGAIDVHLARTLARLVPNTAPSVTLAAALASRAVQQGHVCVDLRGIAGKPLTAPEQAESGEVIAPALDAWLAALVGSALVATHVDESAPRPLVLDTQGRLYLYRYARYQQRLAASLKSRAAVLETVDEALLADGLRRLFPGAGQDEQKRAAAVASLRRFSVISGGPGTGKTFTVARIVALLQEQATAGQGPALRIKALAPTGKAAQRLMESMTAAIENLATAPDVRAASVTTTSTIHRALGFLPQTPTRFRHNQDNPLPADVVVVDEASMVDLALMSKLVDAVPTTARLILLGDKDQLASVEAGSILADIYGDDKARLSPHMAERLRKVGVAPPDAKIDPGARPSLNDGCVHLTRSRRYAEDSGIAKVARAVNAGDAATAMAAATGDVRMFPAVGTGLPEALRTQIMSAFMGIASATPVERLALLSNFKILCAHRRGPSGADVVNPQVEALLAAHSVIRPDQLWYDGRPILITANDPVLELYNGDVGVICVDAEKGVPLAHFASLQGAGITRSFAPARLPLHETVFAMTVHKSQGSEFDHVALLFPPAVSHVLTRELVYTAITRAKRAVDIYASAEVFAASIVRHVERASGLNEALRAEPG